MSSLKMIAQQVIDRAGLEAPLSEQNRGECNLAFDMNCIALLPFLTDGSQARNQATILIQIVE